MTSVDWKESIIKEASRPQEGRHSIIKASIDNLNDHEFQKMNRIIDEEYNKKQENILDKPFGEVINNTVNFFGNSSVFRIVSLTRFVNGTSAVGIK